jgi:peptidoglycan hydrolase-like protein with peptidoglycan-binding domain
MTKKLLTLASAIFIFAAIASAQGTATTTGTTASAVTTKKPPVFRPTKDQIKQVQTMLKDKKLYTGEASGTYNDDTRTGIKSFQKTSGLKETGTLNRATLEKFGVALTDSQKAIPVTESSLTPETNTGTAKTKTTATAEGPKRPAPFRANSDQIKSAQRLLKDGKMYTGEETGKFDDAFRDGLGKYQEANGLKVTKTLNAATLEKMSIALTDAQKANVAAQAAYDAAKKN